MYVIGCISKSSSSTWECSRLWANASSIKPSVSFVKKIKDADSLYYCIIILFWKLNSSNGILMPPIPAKRSINLKFFFLLIFPWYWVHFVVIGALLRQTSFGVECLELNFKNIETINTSFFCICCYIYHQVWRQTETYNLRLHENDFFLSYFICMLSQYC